MKVLFVTPGNPFSDYGGLAIYTRQAIDSLVESVPDIDLTVLCLIESPCDDVSFGSIKVQSRPIKVFVSYSNPLSRVRKFFSLFSKMSGSAKKFHQVLVDDSLASSEFDFLILNHRLSISLVDRFIGRVGKILYISHNDELNSVTSISKYFSNPLLKMFVIREAKKIFKEELELMRRSARVCFINKTDMNSYLSFFNEAFRSQSLVVPPYFSRPNEINSLPDKEKKILLVGSYDWLPKKKNAEWLINEVFPLVKKGYSGNVKLVVVGRGADCLKVCDDRAVEVHSDVPSVAEYYIDCSIFAIPECQKGGIKLKAIEAASYGLPIVATRSGVDGVGLVDGVSCFVVDDFDKQDFAFKLVRLLDDETLGCAMGGAAYKLFDSFFTYEPVKSKWANFWNIIERR